MMNFTQYRAAWDNAPTITPAIPLCLDLELATACNLKCPFCFLQNPAYKNKPAVMPIGMARIVLDEAATIGIPSVKFNWRGCPTVHPAFTSILQYASTLGFLDLLVNTNGNFTDDAVDGLMCATKVMVSLDSMNTLTYKQMRSGGNLMRVLTNINSLIERGHKNLWVRRVVTELNKAEDFKGLVRAAFGDSVKISEHAEFERSKQVAIPKKRAYCGYPSQRLIVSVDGKVFPCCVDYFETLPLGDIKHDKLMDIWHGDAINALRQGLKQGNYYPSQCSDCRSWMGYADKRREMVADKEIV
jgi:radical SAM protein with 4Fe4S-binding SPASM domain